MPDTPDKLAVKKRDVYLTDIYGRTDSYAAGPNGGTVYNRGNPIHTALKGAQITASEGHPWTGSSGYKGDDVGGPFETTRRYLAHDRWGRNPLERFSENTNSVKIPGAGVEYRFHGNILPGTISSNSWPSPDPSSNQTLIALGTKAIAMTKPTNSIADLSVSLAETLREGLPSFPGRSLWKERAQIARGAGSEYLNSVFGWLPLVSEVQNVAKVIDQGDKIWRQYQRDSGRLVRRRYEFPDDISTPELRSRATGQYPYPLNNTYFFQSGGAGGTRTVWRHKRRRQWFSGGYTYWIPGEDDSRAVGDMLYAASRARKLYGLTVDPEVLWNLAPWSWATDWFLNTGDIIANMSDFATDGLLLRYGYMMEETIVTDEITLEGIRWACSPRPPSSLSVFLVTKTLKRVRATPYGFGLIWDDFSPRQLAIMAALGITLKPR